MTSRVLAEGHGVRGLMAYVCHDEGHATTRDRVAGMTCRGVPMVDVLREDAELAKAERLLARVLASTAADGPALKRLAGLSARGRKCKTPFRHIALSWPNGERPTWKEMVAAGDSWIAANGLGDHRIVMVGHVEDGKPTHLHLIVCVVHPETGRVHQGNLALGGSRWAEAWEREHGGIQVPTRVARNAARDKAREAYARGDAAAARAAFRQFPATEKTRSDGRGKLTEIGARAYSALRREQETVVAALRALLRAENASRREENRLVAALKRRHRHAADILARAHRPAPVSSATAAPSLPTEHVAAAVAPEVAVAATADEPAAAPPPALEAAPALTPAEGRAAMKARSRLHDEQPEGIPLTDASLRRAAERLRRDGDDVGLVGATVLERTGVLRDADARAKAEEAERSMTSAAEAALIDALIETVRTLCRAALHQPGPASPPVRPTATTPPPKTPASIDVARDDQAPRGGQAR